MPNTTINGKTYEIPAGTRSVEIINGKLILDGKVAEDSEQSKHSVITGEFVADDPFLRGVLENLGRFGEADA